MRLIRLITDMFKIRSVFVSLLFVNAMAHQRHGVPPTVVSSSREVTQIHVHHPHATITGNKPVFSIVCSELNVTGYWMRTPFVGNILQVSLIDSECNKFSTNLTNFWITAPFGACGSVIEAHEHVIIQRNSATVKVINVTNNVISREHVYKYNMECVFPRKKNVSIGDHYNVTDSITRTINSSSLGTFKTFIAVYDSPSFMRRAITPVTVTTNQPIYIGIKKITENKNFRMIVQQCFATPSSNIHDVTSYIFFHNKCALDSTFKMINWNQHEFNFVIKTFKFIKISQVVYIHCRIYICRTNSTSPLCDQTCSYRKRRDVKSYGARAHSSYKIQPENHLHRNIHDVYLYRMRNEMSLYRKRRSLDDEYFSGTSELEDVRYITSSRILYVKKHSCQDVNCPFHSTCVDLYPAVCFCDAGYVLKFKTNTCVSTGILNVVGLHLNKTWMESYSDTKSMEFRHLAYKTEMELRRLFHALYLPEIQGVKITRARKGSVILDFNLIVSDTSTEMTTYDSLVRAILIGNKTGLSLFREMEIIPEILPTIQKNVNGRSMKDNIILLTEIAIPSLFVISIVLFLLVHKLYKVPRNKKPVSAIYESKNPVVVTFCEDNYFTGIDNSGYIADEPKVFIPDDTTRKKETKVKYTWDDGCMEFMM